MNIKYLILLTVFFGYPALAKIDCSTLKNKTYNASIVSVADGDTATVRLNNTNTKIDVRFFGVDTPESSWKGHWPTQNYSYESKLFTINALNKKDVQVTFTGAQTYSRCVGEIFVNNKSHSLSLVQGGYAWWYSKYSGNRTDLKRAQTKARNSKIGLWANPNAQAPWNYRRQYSY